MRRITIDLDDVSDEVYFRVLDAVREIDGIDGRWCIDESSDMPTKEMVSRLTLGDTE